MESRDQEPSADELLSAMDDMYAALMRERGCAYGVAMRLYLLALRSDAGATVTGVDFAPETLVSLALAAKSDEGVFAPTAIGRTLLERGISVSDIGVLIGLQSPGECRGKSLATTLRVLGSQVQDAPAPLWDKGVLCGLGLVARDQESEGFCLTIVGQAVFEELQNHEPEA